MLKNFYFSCGKYTFTHGKSTDISLEEHCQQVQVEKPGNKCLSCISFSISKIINSFFDANMSLINNQDANLI